MATFFLAERFALIQTRMIATAQLRQGRNEYEEEKHQIENQALITLRKDALEARTFPWSIAHSLRKGASGIS